jgi:hypothetical protein
MVSDLSPPAAVAAEFPPGSNAAGLEGIPPLDQRIVWPVFDRTPARHRASAPGGGRRRARRSEYLEPFLQSVRDPASRSLDEGSLGKGWLAHLVPRCPCAPACCSYRPRRMARHRALPDHYPHARREPLFFVRLQAERSFSPGRCLPNRLLGLGIGERSG